MPLATRRPPSLLPARASQTAPSAKSGIPAQRLPGQRYFLFDVPFEFRDLPSRLGAKWDPKAKACVFFGVSVPEGLEEYRCKPHSWERLKEDEMNGFEAVASAGTKEIVLRDHQKEAVRSVRAARKAGRTGYLIADDVGLGKTMETWAAVLEDDAETVLIVCPLAVVAHWRRTIEWMGDKGKRVVVLNYDRLKKLFDIDAAAQAKLVGKRRKGRRIRTQKGIARFAEAYEFDLIVWDECQKLRNPESARSKLAKKLSAEADFELWLSATAGQHPLELSYLSSLLAESSGVRVSALSDYVAWCQSKGIGVIKGAYGKVEWRGASKDEKLREGADEDLETMRRLLFEGAVPAGIRRSPTDIAGWPEINRILLPVDLGAEDRMLYDQAWGEFRRQLELEATGRGDPKNALVIRLRFRQKASLLRTSATVDHAVELLEQGQQVAISVAFKETLAVIRDALLKEGYGVTEIHGSIPPAEKESNRLDFQHGRKTVCIYTVEEAISLHQGEYNNAPRSNIIHDIRWSSIQMKQIEGRTHRDGKFSQVYWMVGADTVEEGIAEVVAGRIRAMSKMQGDDATVDGIERLLLDLGRKIPVG